MHLKRLLCGAGILLAFSATAQAGTRAFPLATKKSVALAIFNAIADGVETKERRAKYIVEIHDLDDKWEVSEALRDDSFFGNHDEAKVTLGGGGLEINIEKCGAIVSDAYFAK